MVFQVSATSGTMHGARCNQERCRVHMQGAIKWCSRTQMYGATKIPSVQSHDYLGPHKSMDNPAGARTGSTPVWVLSSEASIPPVPFPPPRAQGSDPRGVAPFQSPDKLKAVLRRLGE